MAGRRSTGAPHDDAVGPSPGDEVAGVLLTALVGRGGAGTVWSGTEVRSGARVAVKLLDGPTAGREAALLAGLQHPHVLPLRRVVSDPPAIVTDLAAGGSLAAQVAARGTLAPGEVVTVLAPLADALAALHAQGLVHGDVTASNVLFVDKGRPVLADLGVAGLVGDGVAWATPGYAAPEVLAGARPGPAADVHGLGAAAWLALTGSVPPPHEDRLPLGLLAPDCPAGLLTAVTAALDTDPAQRPDPGELAAAARASCPGLVVRLVPGAALGVRADEAVTYRVREAAAADPQASAHRGWLRLPGVLGAAWARLVARSLSRRLPGAVGLRAERSGRSARRRAASDEPPRQRHSLAATATVTAVVVAGLLATAAGAGWLPRPPVDVGGGGAAEPSGTVAAVEQPVAAEEPDPPVPPDATTPAAEAGPADLTATVAGLVEAREQALRAADAEALTLVHAAEGTTLADDRALVQAGPLDVSYDVVEVRPVPGQPRSARVRLHTTTAGATTTEEVVLELASAADGWRVRAVTR